MNNSEEFSFSVDTRHLPWTTGITSYEQEATAVRGLYDVFWGDENMPPQPRLALDMFRGILNGFREKHAEELSKAEAWHAAEGSGAIPITRPRRGPGFDRPWPVESWLKNYEELYVEWEQIAESELSQY